MRLLDKLFAPMIDRRIEAFESDLISRQCEEVETMYRTMRGWRHDYHNHIQTLLALVGDGNEAVKNYLLDLNNDLTTVDTVIKTGNVMVDAILNSKLSLIREKKIEVNAKAVVPKNLSVSEIDLCSMLGNLLDNAIEGASTSERPWIRVFLGIMKGSLYLSVSNSMADLPKKAGGHFLSRKGEGRGFGLGRIDRIAEKYGGVVNRQFEEGVFATEILLPLPNKMEQSAEIQA